MRDPSTANCRLYLGNLELNTSKSDIQNIFSKYGNIKGIMISRNFGFVQYDNEQCVNIAIENEHQKMFKGRKMVVSKVQPKKGNNQGNQGNQGNQVNQVNQKGNDNKSNAVISEPPSNQNITNDPKPAQSNNDININTPAATSNNPLNSVNLNKNPSHNMSNANSNSNNNNNVNNNAGNSQQNMGNNSSRPQWRNNRNNNRNMNNSNEMNLQTDRERSPLDGGL